MNRLPPSLMFLAILGVIWGGLSVLCTPLGLVDVIAGGGSAPLWMPGQGVETIEFPPAVRLMLLASAVVGFVGAILLLAGSIGTFMRRAFARPCMNTYAALSLVNTIVTTIVQVVVMLPVMIETMASGMPNPPPREAMIVGGIFGVVCAILCQAIFPLCVLFFYNTRTARAALDPDAQEELYPPPHGHGGYPQPPQGYQQPWQQWPGQQQGGYPPQPPPPQYPPPPDDHQPR